MRKSLIRPPLRPANQPNQPPPPTTKNTPYTPNANAPRANQKVAASSYTQRASAPGPSTASSAATTEVPAARAFSAIYSKPAKKKEGSHDGYVVARPHKSKLELYSEVGTLVASRTATPSEVEGLRFMYECVAGLRDDGYGESLSGCILAHSMGLGKSLQALSLVYTMLKAGPTGCAAVRKAVIISPASLCDNWAAECARWLGVARIKPVVLVSGPKAARIAFDFATCPPQQLLITSYETFKSHAESLRSAPIGLIVCDEGHRLKNSAGNATSAALRSIENARRIILTGTPVQNDLDELWALCDFASPGALPPLATFRSVFAVPLEVAQRAGATDVQKQLAVARGAELKRLYNRLVQTRDRSVLEASLPVRRELVLCCALSAAQVALYECALTQLKREHSGGSMHLHAVMALRAICSSGVAPAAAPDDSEPPCPPRPPSEQPQPPLSSKLALLFSLLPQFVAAGDRAVVVSQFKATLDALQRGFESLGLGVLRVDGSVTPAARQDLVDRFNRPHSTDSVFLLSSRAGGTGFNLTSANRLILFDPDWNPAIDEQAIARVYRPGQEREVYIWRLYATSTIEEKMFERQIFKNDLTSDVVSDSGAAVKLDPQSMRDIFAYNRGVRSSTLRSLLCVAGRAAEEAQMSSPAAWIPVVSDARLRAAIEQEPTLGAMLSYVCNLETLRALRDDDGAAKAVGKASFFIDTPPPSASPSPSPTPTPSPTFESERQPPPPLAVAAEAERPKRRRLTKISHHALENDTSSGSECDF